MSQPVIAVMAQYPEFIKPPNEVNLIGVNGGKVECEIFGVPKPKVTWFKDYHAYKETYRVQAYHYPPQVKILTARFGSRGPRNMKFLLILVKILLFRLSVMDLFHFIFYRIISKYFLEQLFAKISSITEKNYKYTYINY